MGQWMSSAWDSGDDYNLPAVLALQTGNPPQAIGQTSPEMMDVYENVMKVKDEHEMKKLKNILKHSGIDKRYFSYSDPMVDYKDRTFMPNDKDSMYIPLMETRNDLYVPKAIELAARVSGEALKEWGGDPKDITHVINVSCTGMIAPGIEFRMIEKLGLKDTVQRYGLNFMGCYGGTRALSLARSICEESEENRVLFWCIELCSLQYQHFPENKGWTEFIGSVLFADGCAACVMGKELRDFEKGIWYLKNTATTVLQNTPDDMTYFPSSTGFKMTLARSVPSSVSMALLNFLSNHLCADEVTPSDDPREMIMQLREFEYLVHPGGRLILDKVQANLFLKEGHLDASYEVLKNFGNMSSATILFVMDCFRKRHPEWMQSKAIALAFGPGLAVDGVLFYPCRN